MAFTLYAICNNNRYRWEPTKSTPSAKKPILELSDIIKELKKNGASTVIDFGAGRGRNAHILSKNFSRVVLVEDDSNIQQLSNVVHRKRLQNVTIQSWNQFQTNSQPKVDAVFLSFVVHTLPTPKIRSTVLKANLNCLKSNGSIVFITPRHDPKYSPSYLRKAVHFKDGIIRLYEHQKLFSFYRNYTPEQFQAFIVRSTLCIVKTIPSESRMIFICHRKV